MSTPAGFYKGYNYTTLTKNQVDGIDLNTPLTQPFVLSQIIDNLYNLSNSSHTPQNFTYDFGGSAYDYTTDPNYSPASLYQVETGPACSGILGDGETTPNFYMVGTDRTGGLERTSTGLRIIDDGTSRLDNWPVADDGCQIIIPLPLSDYLKVTVEYSTNMVAAMSVAPTFSGVRLSILQPRDYASQQRPRDLVSTAMYMFSSLTIREDALSSQIDISSGTSAGINTRKAQFEIYGPINKLLTSARDATPVLRRTLASPRIHLGYPLPVVLCLGLARNGGTLSAPLWTEIRSLSIDLS